MDLGTVIVGSMCVTICALPFVLINISTKRKEKEILELLNKVTANNHSKLTEHEICGNYAIGIDTQKKTLFFVRKIHDKCIEQIIDLSSVFDCKLVNTKRSTKGGKIIQRLYLQLSYKKLHKKDDVLEFYNADDSFQLSGEIQSIEKWNNIISSILVSNK